MSGYAKLSSAIVHSTVWREPNHVRIVWITMLALADAGGYVAASVPGLADAARVSLEECQEALACFQRADTYSRTAAHEGRRIEVADGGWVLLNYGLYRAGRDPETRRRQNREAQQRHRDRKHVSHGQPDISRAQPGSAQAEAEAEAEAEAKRERRKARKSKPERTEEQRQAHQQLTEHYFTEFERLRGTKPIGWGKKEGQAVYDLLDKCDGDATRARTLVTNGLTSWSKATIASIASNPSASVVATTTRPENGQRAGDLFGGQRQRVLELQAQERETQS